jgi:Fe-Mn family superoxide dismutase
MADETNRTHGAADRTRGAGQTPTHGGQATLQGSQHAEHQSGQHQLPPLPYALDALEPHMSAETLQFHHGKHHKTYVDKVNQLIAGTHYETLSLEEIVRDSQDALFNNAAQAWNHTFFWNCLSPAGGGKPRGALAQAIDTSFGSFDAFKDKFTASAIEVFGSGWAWLVQDGTGALSIEKTANADTPIAHNGKPLLTCDVWEHAYYIDYRNARPEFLKAYWNIVNWQFAMRNFEGQGARA